MQNITKVLILSVSPRSGSSYISEILSSPPMTSLWSEPLRFLYEKPPKDVVKSRKFFNNELTEFTKPSENEQNKDKRYRLNVSKEEKLSLISQFMNCKFVGYAPLITSQVSRQFIFKLPYPALGKEKGPISPLMLKKIYLRKGKFENGIAAAKWLECQ